MRLLIVNPNATEEMTDTIVRSARKVLGSSDDVFGLTNADGPPAIQGAADGDAAVPGVLNLIEDNWREADAVVIACFDDTGLAEAKRVARVPVLGIGEASFHTACLFQGRFTVVTTLTASVPVIQANVARYGFGEQCARVRASGVPVLDLEANPSAAARRIGMEIERAAAEDAPGAVILGCAGMGAIVDDLPSPSGVTIIETVAAAALTARVASHFSQTRGT